MRIVTLAVAASLLTGLAACKEEAATCTPEQAQAKMTEMATLVQTVAASNPEKLAEITPKMTEIQQTLAADPTNSAAACKALDDMIAALK